MTRNRDENTGKYTEVYSEEDITNLLAGTRLSTTEIAENLDCHRTTAFEKLRTYEEQGLVESTSVGNTLLWELVREK